MITISKCECGKRKSKDAIRCNACSAKRHAEQTEKARQIVNSGKCPQCGAGFRRNLAMTGWWQCEQFGDGQFRKDQTKPKCSFQCFTA